MRKRVHLSLLIILSITLIFSACTPKSETEGETEGNVVAKVGNETITLEEVKKAGGRRPHKTFQQEYDALKKALDRKVQDELYQLAARDSNLQNSPQVKQRVGKNSERFLIQALYEKKIKDNVEVSDKELKEYYNDQKKEVRASHILLNDKSLADSLYKVLKNEEADFGKLARNFSEDPGSKRKGGDLGFFTIDKMVPEFAKKAFSMKKGEICEPLKTQFGWHIIKVTGKRERDLAPFKKKKKDEKFVEKYKKKQEKKAAQSFLDSLFEEANIEFNPKGKKIVLQAFKDAKVTKQKSRRGPPRKSISLSFTKDELGKTFMTYKYDSWKVSDFKKKFNQVPPTRKQKIKSENGLKEFIKKLLQRKLIVKKANEMNLKQSDIYQEKYDEALNQMLAQTFKRKYLRGGGQPSEKDIKQYYQNNKDEFSTRPKVQVREIQVKTKDKAKNLVNKLNKGADFAELAKEHTLRNYAKKKGGMMRPFSERRYPKLYEAAQKLNKGEVEGPIKSKGKYSIIKLKDKIEGGARPFEKVKRRIKSKLRRRSSEQKKQQWLAKAKKNYNVEKNLDRLRNSIDKSKYQKSQKKSQPSKKKKGRVKTKKRVPTGQGQ